MDNTDKKDLLTVKEFAEAAGVSRQRIYKLMVDSLQPYTVKQENGYTLIKSKALELFGKAVELKPCNPTELKPCNSTQSGINKENESNLVDSVQPDRVETLQQQNAEKVDSVQQQNNNDYVRIPAKTLEMLQQQLTEKDKQISLLQAALTAEQLQNNNLTAALNAAQALHAGTIQERLSTGAGQSSDQESPADQTEESRAGDQTEEQDPPPKRGLISRLFNRIRRF